MGGVVGGLGGQFVLQKRARLVRARRHKLRLVPAPMADRNDIETPTDEEGLRAA